MSYIGNQPTTASFPLDTFNGDDSTTQFTLTQSPGSASAIDVHVGSIYQTPGSGYTVSGNVITFTSAPPTGTNNIVVVHKGVQVQIPTPGAGTVGESQMATGELPFSKSFISSEQTITSAGALTIAHSLGASPSLVQIRIICKTAELGYSIDDEAIINTAGDTSTVNRAMSVVPDSTNINIRYGSDAKPVYVVNKTTGGSGGVTNASWKLIVRAWV